LIFEFLTGFNGTNIYIAVCETSLNALNRESAVRVVVNKSSQLISKIISDAFEVGIVPVKTVYAWAGV